MLGLKRSNANKSDHRYNPNEGDYHDQLNEGESSTAFHSMDFSIGSGNVQSKKKPDISAGLSFVKTLNKKTATIIIGKLQLLEHKYK